MTTNYRSAGSSPNKKTPFEYNVESSESTCVNYGVQISRSTAESKTRASHDSFRRDHTLESSPSNDESCIYRARGLIYQQESFPLAKGNSIKRSSPLFVSKTRDKRHIRQRRRRFSSPTESEDSGKAKIEYSERVLNRRNRTPSIPHESKTKKTSYFVDRNREKSRSRRTHKHSVSPIQPSKERCRASKNHSKARERSRHRPRTPPTPDKSIKLGEKVPYFADVVREKDRLRRKYKSPSPLVTSSKQNSKSRTPRRYYSRSRQRSYSRSRSRSRYRKSESDHHRHKREDSPYKAWPAPPPIITIPIPVPDYSFAFPPYYQRPRWPPFPIRPTRFPCFPHHRDRKNLSVPFNAMSSVDPSPIPPLSPMRFMPPYGFDGMPHCNTMSPMRLFGRDLYRYPFS